MSDTEEQEQDYKTKRLEVLARAREIARQNRLQKTAEKKDEHKKQVTERKIQKAKLTQEINQRLNKKEFVKSDELEEVEEKDEEEVAIQTTEFEAVSSIEKVKKEKPKKKKKQIIVEESSSSESEVEEVIYLKKPKKKPPPPKERTIYRDDSYPGSPVQKNPPVNQIQKKFSDFFTL